MADRVIVLLSGGMDSLVTAAVALNDNENVCFLHVNYGQRTESKELWCFEKLCKHYQPDKSMVLNMDWLGKIGGSSLTDTKINIKKYDDSKEVPQTYVPFRNANLISAAVSWAEVLSAKSIYIGAVEEDSSGYPDCREIFYKSMQQTIEFGSKYSPPIVLVTPIIHMNKSDIVKLGIELKVPFEFSWSCYSDNEIACGVCDSCLLRLRAFHAAGIKDLISYAIEIL